MSSDKGRERSALQVDLNGRTAVVTGANGGIGRAVSRRLVAAGASIFLIDRAISADLIDELSALGATVFAKEVDLTLEEDLRAAFVSAEEALGRIDCLVTAAGVTSLGSFSSISLPEWQRVQAINLTAVFLSAQAVLPGMKRRKFGRIVNIGSVVAKNGGNPRPWLDKEEQNVAANAAYGAAKAGVHALTMFLAKELAADGGTANVVAPGPIASDMTSSFPASLAAQIPVGTLGKPDDVSALVAFLCSDEASFVTGEIIDVNGGLWMD